MICDISDVSAIVCTRNNKRNIGLVIESILAQNPKELIVVDGNSTDGTKEIIKQYPVIVLEDPGQGLALARNIGLKQATGEYIFYSGDDNVYPENAIYKLKRYLISHNIACAGMLNRIQNETESYWAFCANLRWKLRFQEGEQNVVGTPNMYYRDVLDSVGWNDKLKFSDDTDLQMRMKNRGHKLAYSNVICYEIGKVGYRETCARFNMYGISDSEFWNDNSGEWNLRRKLQSILHPLVDELLKPIFRTRKLIIEKVVAFPYFFMIVFFRYKGWIKNSVYRRG